MIKLKLINNHSVSTCLAALSIAILTYAIYIAIKYSF